MRFQVEILTTEHTTSSYRLYRKGEALKESTSKFTIHDSKGPEAMTKVIVVNVLRLGIIYGIQVTKPSETQL